MPSAPWFKIRNWKLALLALICFCCLLGLGYWQLSRAHYKKAILQSFTERIAQPPTSAIALKTFRDWRFYRIEVNGTFDNPHTFLLDNKTHDGKIGYEIYTPFQAHGLPFSILVDRGFIPLKGDRRMLPAISPLLGEQTFIGMLNLPPTYVALGPMEADAKQQWPLRIEFVNLATMGMLLHQPFFPYVLIMDPNDSRAYLSEWKIVTFPPERHTAYAVQWFALALTLLILFVALNRKP